MTDLNEQALAAAAAKIAISGVKVAAHAADTINSFIVEGHRLDRRAALHRYAVAVSEHRCRLMGPGSRRLASLFGAVEGVMLATGQAFVAHQRWLDHMRPVSRTYSADGSYVERHGAPDFGIAVAKMGASRG